MTHERTDTMKSVTGRITAVFLCAGIAASSAWADRYVSPAGGNQPPYDSWANAATSIQTAINAASPDETVWVNRAGGDYTLLKTSPCLDAGIGQTWMTDALDLAGKPRLAYKAHGATGEKLPDMGAYEYNPPPPLGTTFCVR